KVGEIVDLGVKFDIINKSGAWFSYGDTRLGQGRDNVKLLLQRETNLCNEIEGKIRESLRYKGIEEAEKENASESVVIPVKPRGNVRAKIDIAVDDDD
ncbi:MAG: DNA recombination/repair protein RecA, partial [Clostridia bacterium]|nr:DNA recombination/repair protein RecA [Clostridia bacterium]